MSFGCQDPDERGEKLNHSSKLPLVINLCLKQLKQKGVIADFLRFYMFCKLKKKSNLNFFFFKIPSQYDHENDVRI